MHAAAVEAHTAEGRCCPQDTREEARRAGAADGCPPPACSLIGVRAQVCPLAVLAAASMQPPEQAAHTCRRAWAAPANALGTSVATALAMQDAHTSPAARAASRLHRQALQVLSEGAE